MSKRTLKTQAKRLARNRYIRIALLPLLGLIFMIGWILAYIGEQNANGKKSRRQPVKAAKESTLEIGVLAEVGEDSPRLEDYSRKDKVHN
jgi:hypothetical protein